MPHVAREKVNPCTWQSRSPHDLDDLDIVPAAYLEPLWVGEGRTLMKREAAEVVDEWLCKLARLEARGRMVLGRLAATFARRRAHQALGFVRIGDYSRERLGMCEREMRALAEVATALERLPQTAAAFERGEINWSKLRAVASVATASTEQTWLRLAREYTAEALRRIAKRARETSRADSIDADLAGHMLREAGMHPEIGRDPSDDESADMIDGEPRQTLRVRCPRKIVRLWNRVVELARRMAGSELAPWQCAELVAAEAISGAEGATSESEQRWRDQRVESALARLQQSSRPSGELPEFFFREHDGADEHLWLKVPYEIDGLRSTIDQSPRPDQLPDELEQLSTDVDTIDAHELDARMRRMMAKMQRIDWQIGRLLRTMFGPRLYREIGFSTTAAYVRNRLGMCTRKARMLVALERKSWQVSSELTGAYRRGEISPLRASLLLPVVRESSAKDWLERAKQVTIRRLRDEVAWAREILDACSIDVDVFPPPPGASLAFENGLPSDDVQIGAGRDLSRVLAGADADYNSCCEVTFDGPISVIALFHEALAAYLKPFETRWKPLERILEHACKEWESQPRHRDPVFARDGWRCAVPCCSSRKNLHDHHIIFRSQGGENDRDNRIAVCAAHHHHGIHAGRIRARGRVDEGITWELGVRRDGPPLARLRDDRYVTATA